MSRIGQKPVIIPKGVKIAISDKVANIEGPKGKLIQTFSPLIDIQVEGSHIKVTRKSDTKIAKSLHGLTRALIANMICGVTEGYSKELEVVGIGFRAEIKGKKLTMYLGFSHSVEYPIPNDINITTPKPQTIIISGIDKQRVGEIAAQIRAIFPPEPYKGKGIRYKGEYVKKKIGKAATK
ncbi:MAG: 50S ribosomal protein L6 [Candidatus Omnitrophota bacterium]